ncbi:hypothetical protein [Streptomyces sp. NPDC091215]|uniref:hypothetical protein n=1 Tax=Streptomyces sp. NPDC091215 TaxID=3155192 RepID=UPI00343B0F67
MATSFQTPRVVSLAKRPLPQTEFVDASGDVWVATGHTAGGELLLECPEPRDPADAGDGESFPWTLHKVQAAFGPLLARSAVSAA